MLAEVAPLAPAIGAGALLALSLGAFVLFLVAYGLREGYSFSLGALLRNLADKARGIRWVGGVIADAIESIDDAVMDSLGKAVQVTWASASKFFHGAEWLWRETIDATVDFARAVHQSFENLVEGTIPELVAARTRALGHLLGELNHGLDALERRAARLIARGIDRLGKDLTAEKLRAQRGIDALSGKLAARIQALDSAITARLDQVVGYTARQLRALRARVSRVEGLLAAGVITAVAVRALDRRFPWWKCGNVRRFNRQLCRSPFGSLDFMFALAALAVVALDVEDVVHAAEDATDELGDLFRKMAGLPPV